MKKREAPGGSSGPDQRLPQKAHSWGLIQDSTRDFSTYLYLEQFTYKFMPTFLRTKNYYFQIKGLADTSALNARG